jgi:hypothetical protein
MFLALDVEEIKLILSNFDRFLYRLKQANDLLTVKVNVY